MEQPLIEDAISANNIRFSSVYYETLYASYDFFIQIFSQGGYFFFNNVD